MFRKDGDIYIIEEFEKLGVKAFYTSLESGNISEDVLDRDKAVENRLRIIGENGLGDKKIVSAQQTHSKNIKIIGKDDKNYYFENIDAFITKRKDLILMTKHADCLPIYFYDRVNKVIAIAHAGWKGTHQNIGIEVLEKMKDKYLTEKKDVLIALGIGIKSCCYEVGSEFYNKFQEKFDGKLLEKSFEIKDGNYYFDLENFNYEILIDYGIKKENIIKSKLCTSCSNDFNSYRRDGKLSGRNGAFISLI